MRSAGYTLIELLVVISIIALMAVVGLVNFKGFSADQVTIKAVGQIQSLLRLTQSNATSSTLCNGETAKLWYLVITTNNPASIDVRCDTATIVNAYHRSYPIDNVTVLVKCSSDDISGVNLPVTVSYSPLFGQINFIGTDGSIICSSTNSLFITATKQNATNTKSLSITKGGAIDVQ